MVCIFGKRFLPVKNILPYQFTFKTIISAYNAFDFCHNVMSGGFQEGVGLISLLTNYVVLLLCLIEVFVSFFSFSYKSSQKTRLFKATAKLGLYNANKFAQSGIYQRRVGKIPRQSLSERYQVKKGNGQSRFNVIRRGRGMNLKIYLRICDKPIIRSNG